ncbi:MAG: DUF2508 family protein [Firmicutes bacterium]|nr:DUF2508 family protein [Bacillota bacterium]
MERLATEPLSEAIKAAQRDWWVAQQQFEFAVDPEAIDASIYALHAAERRYMLLLKQAKEGVAQDLLPKEKGAHRVLPAQDPL